MLLACQAPLPHAEPVAVVAGPFVVVVARASLSVASPRGVAPGRPEGMPGRSPPPTLPGACPGPPRGSPPPRRPDRSVLPCIFRHLRRQATEIAPTDPPPLEPEPRSEGRISEETLCDWETWASMPRHPLAGYARKMLAAYHAGERPFS